MFTQIVNDLTDMIVPFAKSLVIAIIVFAVGFKLVNLLVKKIKNSKSFQDKDASASGFVTSFISIGLKIMIIISVIAILGVPMSSVIAVLASAGVAIGLAVQGALSNFVGGLMILLFKPFVAGDYVETEGVAGTVREISVFYTVLVTPDNKVITLPNGQLTNSVITNYSAEDTRRVDVNVQIGFDVEIDKVKSILLDAASQCTDTLPEPEPGVAVVECTDKGISYTVRVWCEKANYWDVYFQLLEKTHIMLRNENIDISYPQMEVRIKKD